MAIPKYIQKTLFMKPEVSKIFDDVEAWLDYCRFNLLPFNQDDVYRSREYKDWARYQRRPARKNMQPAETGSY